ncbi:MAG: hypothetical protein IJF84_08750 [Thermoguttaceae bacterium]|nr:hypothetical protein [Thermoguttaceae bacterium]
MFRFLLAFIGIVAFFLVLPFVYKLAEATMTDEEKNDKTPVESNGPDFIKRPSTQAENTRNERAYGILLVLAFLIGALCYLGKFIMNLLT